MKPYFSPAVDRCLGPVPAFSVCTRPAWVPIFDLRSGKKQSFNNGFMGVYYTTVKLPKRDMLHSGQACLISVRVIEGPRFSVSCDKNTTWCGCKFPVSGLGEQFFPRADRIEPQAMSIWRVAGCGRTPDQLILPNPYEALRASLCLPD